MLKITSEKVVKLLFQKLEKKNHQIFCFQARLIFNKKLQHFSFLKPQADARI